MSAKQLLLDFLNVIFFILIVGGAILYFIAGDNFETVRKIITTISPFIVFGALLLLKIRFSRDEKEKRQGEGNSEIVLRLDFMDKTKSDVFMFSLPISVCIVAFLTNGQITMTTFLEASIVLIIAYFWKKWLFDKEQL